MRVSCLREAVVQPGTTTIVLGVLHLIRPAGSVTRVNQRHGVLLIRKSILKVLY